MLKFTLHLTQGRRSFSEAHYGNFDGPPASMGPQAALLMQLRNSVCGATCEVDRCVVSTVPANRRTSTFRLSPVAPPTILGPGVAVDNKAEMGNNAPLVKWDGATFGDAPLPAPPANYYPGGCWDSLFSTTGPDPGQLNKSSPGYTPLNSWLQFLIRGRGNTVPAGSWGYRTRNSVGQVQATGLASPILVGGIIGVVTQAQVFDPTSAPPRPLAPGDKVNLVGWRVANPRKKNLQGAYKIAAVVTSAGPPATWTYYLYATEGFQVSNWPTPGSIGPLLFTYAKYIDYEVAQWVTRKRGESYDRALGRSPIHRTV